MRLVRLPRNLCAFLIAICLLSLPALAHTDVTAGQAKDLIGSTDDLVVVDVREPYEYCDARGHIPGALNFPWNSGVLQPRYEELPMESPILVVCRSGGRSNSAANFLDSKGFSTVYDVLGGMSAWIWDTVPCKYSGGSGTAEDPYEIATAADLMTLGETPDDYDKHFILTADIDLDPDLPGGRRFRTAVIAPGRRAYNLEDESYFTGVPFTGTFDGNDHTISRLTIFGDEHLGLFGQLGSGALMMDVRMVNVNVTGMRSHIGALAGSTGSWSTQGGTVVQCSSTGTIRGGEFLGGLAGENGGAMIQCYSRCAVDGDENVGGLVGKNDNGDITQCWASGAVAGSEDVGGLVGENWEGQVAQCYSMGTVSGDEQAGGLVGSNRGVVTGCYSTGAVWSDGGDEIGGLVGSNRGAVVIRSFWDTATSNRFWSDGGTGLPTVRMQKARTFLDAGWDFVGETENGPNDIWKMWDEHDYPRLTWEPGPNTPLVFIDIDDPGFYGQMSKYEVTNAQYCDFLNTALASGDITVDGNDVYGASGSNSGTDYAGQLYYNGDGSGYTGYGATNGGAARIHYNEGAFSVDNGFGNHPVSYVSWYGAMAFANYYGYHLPTEDQWQAVADYDGTYVYGCGETIDPGIANYRQSEHPDGTTSVGSFGQYGYGMSDMAGNVWEWTSSSLDSNRVFRGGSLGSQDYDCDVSIRGDGIPHVAYWDVGFRVCR